MHLINLRINGRTLTYLCNSGSVYKQTTRQWEHSALLCIFEYNFFSPGMKQQHTIRPKQSCDLFDEIMRQINQGNKVCCKNLDTIFIPQAFRELLMHTQTAAYIYILMRRGLSYKSVIHMEQPKPTL